MEERRGLARKRKQMQQKKILGYSGIFFRANRFGIWIYNMKHTNLCKSELNKKEKKKTQNYFQTLIQC